MGLIIMESANETLALMREALAKAIPQGELAKAFTQSNSATTGLTYYDLQAPALTLYPVITPLRNKLPRISAGRGIQANWKAITKINANGIAAGVSEGNRGAALTTTVQDYFAAFRGMGFEDYVTFEADMAAEGFEDLKARAVQGNLRSLMIAEELTILMGNGGGAALGTTPTPTLAQSASGGAMSNGAIYVTCVALTHQGYRYATANSGVTGLVTRTNTDASTDTFGSGCARASAIATITLAGGGSVQSATASVTPVQGAVAYVWFVGAANAYASCYFYSVTTINSAKFTSVPGSGNVVPADLQSTDRSVCALDFDGFYTMAAKSGTGAYYVAQATGTAGTGTPLTSDGAGGIVELDVALQWYWDNLRLSPSEIWVNSQEIGNMRKRILAGGGSTAVQRFTFQANQQGMTGNAKITGYLNQYGMGDGQAIPISVHPNVPPGTIIFLTHEVPYPMSGVSTVNRILCRRDYYQLEWPIRSRKYEYGVYTDQVLQCYFLPGIGVITNIANG